MRGVGHCAQRGYCTDALLRSQVGYGLVFFWEYFGPMLVWPLFWAHGTRELIYGRDAPLTGVAQDLAMIYVMFHYGKAREG